MFSKKWLVDAQPFRETFSKAQVDLDVVESELEKVALSALHRDQLCGQLGRPVGVPPVKNFGVDSMSFFGEPHARIFSQSGICSAITRPISSEAVAAGEGALHTWTVDDPLTIRKSSTRPPSGHKA